MLFNQKGQSAVEYILLYAVITSILLAVYNSDVMKNFMSQDGEFIKAMKAEIEFGYRHGLPGRDVLGEGKNQINYNSNAHQSFHDGTSTRFFGPIAKYPN